MSTYLFRVDFMQLFRDVRGSRQGKYNKISQQRQRSATEIADEIIEPVYQSLKGEKIIGFIRSRRMNMVVYTKGLLVKLDYTDESNDSFDYDDIEL